MDGLMCAAASYLFRRRDAAARLIELLLIGITSSI
jgi:hypothetical protein